MHISAQNAELKKMIDAGNGFARVGEFEKALALYSNAKNEAARQNASPELASRIAYDIGVCHYQLKQIEQAVGAFETAIKLRPGYEKAYYSLGMAEAERKNWPHAESAFINALAVTRTNSEAWFDLAYVYLAQNDLDRARTAFEMAVRYNSIDSAVSHNNIGVILAVHGEFRRAASEFQSAIRISNGTLSEAVSNLEICMQADTGAYKLFAATNFKVEISNPRLNLIKKS